MPGLQIRPTGSLSHRTHSLYAHKTFTRLSNIEQTALLPVFISVGVDVNGVREGDEELIQFGKNAKNLVGIRVS
jgi:hypothetical protein